MILILPIHELVEAVIEEIIKPTIPAEWLQQRNKILRQSNRTFCDWRSIRRLRINRPKNYC